jgi:predicted RNA-binding protein YlxR (DUF448 family)
MAPKHIPLRTCVHCRQVRSKRQMVRVVRTPSGAIEVDEKGKQAGRGAYLCRNRTCWDGALAQDKLGYALKTRLTLEDKDRLQQYAQSLPCADQVRSE